MARIAIGFWSFLMVLTVLMVTGCGKGLEEGVEQGKALSLTGAGASFPAPVYQIWAHSYTQSTPGVRVNYQSLGSGAGINQIKAGTIDFAGSDNPLTAQELSDGGLKQFPMLTGGVVLIVNLPGDAGRGLRLSRKALAGIFLGKITRWNHPEIAAANPGKALPDLAVTVVHRADASGTSYIFTDYLSKISPEWKEQYGRGSAVKWPVGIGGQKNPGVCNSVAKISGAIGYTEYTYAVEAKLAMVTLENRAGKYVEPTAKSFMAAAASAQWDPAQGFALMLIDQPGDDAWPIDGVTYILYRKDCPPERLAAMLGYFRWCFTTGAASAAKLQYMPMGEGVVQLVESQLFAK